MLSVEARDLITPAPHTMEPGSAPQPRAETLVRTLTARDEAAGRRSAAEEHLVTVRLVLAANGDAEREIALLAASRSAVLVLFRTLLRVHGEPAADSAAEVVRRAARHAGFDPAPFLKVLSHVDGSARIVSAEADALLAAYHAGLERFVAHVDAIVHSGSR